MLVTGATAGFGLAIAKRFVKDGHKVIATGRRVERLAALQLELGSANVHVVELDVRDRATTESFISKLPIEWQDIDVCVNNAGLALGLEPAQLANLDDWDNMIQTNVMGLTYVTRACLPGMVSRNRGHIINIGSTAAEFPYPGTIVCLVISISPAARAIIIKYGWSSNHYSTQTSSNFTGYLPHHNQCQSCIPRCSTPNFALQVETCTAPRRPLFTSSR